MYWSRVILVGVMWWRYVKNTLYQRVGSFGKDMRSKKFLRQKTSLQYSYIDRQMPLVVYLVLLGSTEAAVHTHDKSWKKIDVKMRILERVGIEHFPHLKAIQYHLASIQVFLPLPLHIYARQHLVLGQFYIIIHIWFKFFKFNLNFKILIFSLLFSIMHVYYLNKLSQTSHTAPPPTVPVKSSKKKNWLATDISPFENLFLFSSSATTPSMASILGLTVAFGSEL